MTTFLPRLRPQRLLGVGALYLLFMSGVGRALAGCQRSEQASVQPEKLASSSPSTGAEGAPTSDAAENESASGQPSSSAPGPLLPLAEGKKAPAAAKPTATTTTKPLAPRATAKKPAPEPFSADPDPAPGAAKQAPLPPPKLTLLSDGAEPKKALRLAAKVGHTEKMRMAMRMSIGMEMGGKKAPPSNLPPMLMDMDLEVADDRGDRLRYDFVLSDTAVPATEGIPPKVVKVLAQALGTLKGMKGHAFVTRRGFTQDAKIAMPGTVDAQTQQVVQGMEQALRQISAPLPEEPVGVGATWRVVTHLSQNGVSLKETATYELKKMVGDRVELGVQLEQSAPKQKVKSPVGVTVDLLSLHSSGGGDMSLKLDRIAPVTSQLSLDSAVAMALPENKTMKMSSKMAIGINPKTN
ncbi:MAG TPA: hypothetical protein ENK57_16785 [Polyangiaceae bacterium]|nr:hypothetical protein [Polyangiaceae bacterium]